MASRCMQARKLLGEICVQLYNSHSLGYFNDNFVYECVRAVKFILELYHSLELVSFLSLSICCGTIAFTYTIN